MSETNKTKEHTFADLFNKAVELLRNDTRANPSAERIVELCGFDIASARRVFDEIKKLGWVNRVEFCGGGEGYVHTEHFPAPDYDLGQLKLYKTLFDHKAGAMLVEFSKTGKDLCSPCIRVQVAYGRDMTALEYAQELQATANQMLKVETDNKRVCLDDALFYSNEEMEIERSIEGANKEGFYVRFVPKGEVASIDHSNVERLQVLTPKGQTKEEYAKYLRELADDLEKVGFSKNLKKGDNLFE